MTHLEEKKDWLPGADKLFQAFTLPLSNVRYILFGESPYPRHQSANGYAFWDAAVNLLWSDGGLAKKVNRATSLRNFIKMLLVARGDLASNETSQTAIAALSKKNLVITIDELFNNFLQNGMMLLNASLVLSDQNVRYDAKHWKVFMKRLLQELADKKSDIDLILLGKVAKEIESIPASKHFKQFHAEHPYNLSFIKNPDVLHFFEPFDLLNRFSNENRR